MWLENWSWQIDSRLAWLKKLPKEILDKIEFKPSEEIIKQEVRNIREKASKKYPEKKEYFEKAEIFYAWNYNFVNMYWVMSEDWQYLKYYFMWDWNLFMNVENALNPFPNNTDTQHLAIERRYDWILSDLWVRKEISKTWLIKLFKEDKNWQEHELDCKSPDYMATILKADEMESLLNLKSMIEKPEKWKNTKKFLGDWLFYQILSFKDIEILKQNDMMTQEQFDYAKEKIKWFFFRLVYVGLADREQLDDANRKHYIDTKTYKRCDYYLKTWEFLE